jgi:hypothetical protein
MGDGRFSKWHRGYPPEGSGDGRRDIPKTTRNHIKQKDKNLITY